MPRCLLLSLVVLAACTTADLSTSGEHRGSLGKADTVGTCQDACGDMSDAQDCWCDDECEENGDCCPDQADLCPAPARSCGGFAGLGCAAGEYCHYELDAICGAADQTGTCQPRTEICSEHISPVCGCDGQSYSNECRAAAAGTSVAREGDCDAPVAIECGGFANLDCPSGLVCVDDPNDGCDTEHGGADCGGICVAI
jgi:hypothetical protein